jgi:hypothetical protein
MIHRIQLHRFIYAAGLVIILSQLSCSPQSTPPAINSASTNESLQDESKLQTLVDQTLRYNLEHRLLSADRNAAWQVLHGIIAYGEWLPLQVGDEKKLAVDYLLSGGELGGWDLYPGTDLGDGRTGIRARVEAGGYIGQGHVDQWLAILAQVDVPLNRKVTLASTEHTIADWIDQSLLDVPNNPLEEYSWTLISAVYYRPEKQTWTGIDKTELDLATLAEFEAEQDITESACGGSHRLMGLARAVNYAKERGVIEKPGFAAAKNTLDRNIDLMKQYQNSDGTFSTNYFARPGRSADLALMISATGHQIEVAAYALSDTEVKSEWLRRAVVRFCEMLEATKDQPLECGGLYHGLKGLRIYYDRCFGKWSYSDQ